MATSVPKRDINTTSAKTNYCHYMIKNLFGFAIHPKIELPTEHVHIADFGTETAIWPTDVAETLHPTAIIDGFDISPRCFPPEGWLPKNLSLHVQDILKPFPEKFEGQYDLIHIRFLLALSNTQVKALLQNIQKLLKPGGYVQWIENDRHSVEVVATSPDISRDAVSHLVELQAKPFPNFDPEWLNNVPSAMTEEGFENVAFDRIPMRDSLRSQMNQIQLLALSDMAGLSPIIDEYRDKYGEKLREEFASGVSTKQDYICIVARKSV